jgi:hypothetical protein
MGEDTAWLHLLVTLVRPKQAVESTQSANSEPWFITSIRPQQATPALSAGLFAVENGPGSWNGSTGLLHITFHTACIGPWCLCLLLLAM